MAKVAWSDSAGRGLLYIVLNDVKVEGIWLKDGKEVKCSWYRQHNERLQNPSGRFSSNSYCVTWPDISKGLLTKDKQMDPSGGNRPNLAQSTTVSVLVSFDFGSLAFSKFSFAVSCKQSFTFANPFSQPVDLRSFLQG